MDAADIAAFFNDPESSVAVTRSRLLADDVTFHAIPGFGDDGALDNRVLARTTRLAFATGPDIKDGDTVTITATGALALYAGQYRALEVTPVNDGLESRATLQRLPG
ncbi:MAG: hypothetical protein RL456_2289 [Pseudomonadota bacterium]|jgi:hypothetical protein